MLVVVDSIVASFDPETIGLWQAVSPALTIEIIDSFLSPAKFAQQLSQLKPDVLVVAPVWLTITPLLFKVLELSGNTSTPRIIATKECDDVLKIQSAHHGYSNVLDLNLTPTNVVAMLENNHLGSFSLHNDDVWSRVPLPLMTPDLTNVPRDNIDVQILDLITIGLRDQDVASALYLSLQTVKNRISKMLEISGADNRTQLGFLYSNQRLISVMLMNIESEYIAATQ